MGGVNTLPRQDRQGVRSPTDIEQKYDLGAIGGLKTAVQLNEKGIYNTNQSLVDFTRATTANFEEVKTELDEKAEIWFYSGVPTLENEPASKWSNEDYPLHLGDMYYDQDTGYAYRFNVSEGVYAWEEIKDQDVAAALAKANAASDTADRKRQIFTAQPAPPYDNGDLWIKDLEIYVCQISKVEGESYFEGDFIIATKYTDDTKADQVGDDLTILKGTVTEIRESADSFQIDITQKFETVNAAQKTTEEELKQTAYRFGTESFTVEKSGSELKTAISEDGMKVYRSGEVMLEANSAGVDAQNLHATTYLIIGNNSRFEDYSSTRTACFWIGE